MPAVIVILHNIRSTHNVGAIFRTAEGFGIEKLIISGYTPAPHYPGDSRLPHIATKLHNQIHKTALGAEAIVPFEVVGNVDNDQLHQQGYRIVGLEQAPHSIVLSQYQPTDKIALILGEEVTGIDDALLATCDDIIEIPMAGKKESFNVSVATGIALYHLTLS